MNETREQLSEIFNIACEMGDVSTIRKIIKENPGYIDIESNDGYGFKKACEKGHVNIIDYLTKTQELVKNIDIDYQENIGFFIACQYGQSEVIKYYFNIKDYQIKKGLINTVFIKSCEQSSMEMYTILKEYDLLRHINPEWNQYQGFKHACKNEITEITHEIIFNLNLPLSDKLNQWLKEEKYERIINMFKKREMYKDLNNK